MPNERLIVTMEAKDQLSPALRKAGEAAKDTAKEVEKITAADVANFGRGMLQGAQRLATGLYGLATASSDLAEAQNFSNQIFREAAPAINDYAKKAATSIGMSERAALDAAASVGIFGQRIELTGDDLAKFSTDLVTLAADMASIKNTKPEEAVTAIAAAMRNEYEPIRRYGVVLNDVVLKARALEQGTYDGTGQLTQQQKIIAVNAELYDQLGFAMGDFMRTQNELANQTRIAQAQFENLKANLGDALRPAFITMTSTANSFLTTLMKIPEPVKAIGANMALVGTAALGLGGALLFTVGKIGDMIGQAREMKARMDAMSQSGGRATQAMIGIGKGVAGLIAVAAATEMVGQTFNQITDVSGKTQRAIEGVTIAFGRMDSGAAVDAFTDLIKVENEQFKMSGLWEDFGRTFEVSALGIKSSVENMDDAFGKLTTDQQAKMIAGFKELLPTLEEGSDDFENLTDIISRYEPQVQSSVQATQALGQEGELSAETMAQFGDDTVTAAEAQKELQKAEEDAAKAAEDARKQMEEYARAVTDAERAFDTAAEKAEAFGEGLDKSTGPSALLQNVADIQGAFDDLIDSFKDDDGNIDKTKMSMDAFTESGRDNIAAMEDLSGIMNDRLLMVYEASGGSINAVTDAQKGMVEELNNVLRAAGATDQQIADFNATLGQTPEAIEVAIRIRDDQVALQKLDMLNLKMDEIPPEISMAIMAEMDEGDFVSAYQIAKNFIAGQPLKYGTRVDDPTTPMREGIDKAQTVADGTPINMPTIVDDPTTELIEGVAIAQGAANDRPIDVPAGVAGVEGMPAALSGAQGAADADPPTTELVIEPGDVQTPQGKNIAYAKSNKPLTTIETESGDYQRAWREIDSYTKSHDPKTTIETDPGNFRTVWALIAFYFGAKPVTVYVQAEPSNIGFTWNVIAFYFGARPVTVKVQADPTNLGAAWSEIQSYFNGRPVTVRINAVPGSVTMPNVPTSTRTTYRPPAPPGSVPVGAEAAAMSEMGVTAVGDTLLAAPAPVSAGRRAPATTPSIVNLNVTMPPGINEAKVLDVLKNYQRSNGRRIIPRG
jgi:hypothetical protein